MLGSRGIGNVGWSISLWGDSYAFGIAGTGGTSSSPPAGATFSVRGFGVGSREDEEGVSDSRAWFIPELLAGLWNEVLLDDE